MRIKHGFTLAEVLVTLGIIGVVAAMTIPTLVNQTSDAEYKTGLKKAVSVLSQAVTMNYALHGIDFSEITGAITTADGDASLPAIFSNRLNVTNSSATWTGTQTLGATYLLNDGMLLHFTPAQSACTAAVADNATTGCVVYVDVNGPKKPNRLSSKTGKSTGSAGDIFKLKIYNQKVEPGDAAARYMLFDLSTTTSGS